jgi:uncharacterized membrane protein YjjP (DUF1212 family)
VCFVLKKKIKIKIKTKHLSHSVMTTCLAYGTLSFGATVLFFGGTWLDGSFSFLFGLAVFMIGKFCEQFHGLSEIECFLSSLVISFLSSILDSNLFFNSKLCLYGQMLGGVVWLLPGITITIALLEIYSQMIVYGSSRLIYGTFIAMQLGKLYVKTLKKN